MIRGGIVGGYYGIIGTGGAGLSEADVIALIEARDGVIDGTPGILPVAAAVQKLKLAPDNSGLVRTLVERVHHAVPRSGSFSVYTHAHYRGPFAFAPFPGEDTDDIFYYTAHQYFARVRQVSPGNYQWRQTTIADALGADAVWLGHVATQAAALARIGTFDETESYFAYTTADQNVMLLSNSSYVAGSGESRTYEWRSITGDTVERVARLEDQTPHYWQQLIDEPVDIRGNDTHIFDDFNLDLLDEFLDVDLHAYGLLVVDVTLEKVTNLRIDAIVRIKHGADVIKEETIGLQNANTEFSGQIKTQVVNVSDGITVEVETENSDDTTQDVTVSEVKLRTLAAFESEPYHEAPASEVTASGNLITVATTELDGDNLISGQRISLTSKSDNDGSIFFRINTSDYRVVRRSDGSQFEGGEVETGDLLILEYRAAISTWVVINISPPQEPPARKWYYGEGQSDRDDVQQSLGDSDGPWPFAFDGGDANETDFEEDFDIVFTDIGDETDSDVTKSLATSDNHVFSPDAGTYDLLFEAVGNQSSQASPGVALYKIESGVDDRRRVHRPGWTTSSESNDEFDTTYRLIYKSLRVEDGDKFYFLFTGFSAASGKLMAGSLLLEKLS